MNEYDAAGYLSHISSLLEKEIIPAYQRLGVQLDSLQKEIPPTHSAANQSYFSYRLDYQLGTSISLDSAFKAGEIESNEIKTSLVKGLNEIGILGSVKEQIYKLDQDTEIPSDSIDKIVDTYKAILHDISLKSIGLFEVFEKPLRLETRVSNLSLSKNRISFLPEALDGSSKASLLINVSPKEKHSTWRMKSEIYRNGIPGLFVLDVSEKYKKSEQDFWKILQSPSFFQGWATYADYLLKNDVLLYAENSEEEMGYFYNNYLLVNGALVDIGINQKGWSIEDAFRFLSEEKGILTQDGWNLVERAASYPGDLTAEWIGANRFLKIRESVSKRLGNKFFLQEFHDFLILNHPTSWEMLEKQLETFIEQKLAS